MTEVAPGVSQDWTLAANVDALRALMREKGLAALMCAGGVNFMYLTGIAFPGTLGRHLDLANSERAPFAVWDGGDEPPVAVVSEIASQFAAAHGWCTDVRVYRDYRESPTTTLQAVLSELAGKGERVGVDLAWFGAARWHELNDGLPDIEFVDCGPALDRIRAVKTPLEVELLRGAAATLDNATSDVFARAAHVGDSERHLHALIVERAIELGVRLVHGIFQLSSNPVLYGGESSQTLRAGEFARTDYVAYVDGYPANLSRMVYGGDPSQDVLDRYREYVDVYFAAADLLRPGAVGGEIHRETQRLLATAGFPSGDPLCGHGIGSWWHQQFPLLADSSADELAEGMIIAFEPVAEEWHLQDEFLITDGPPVRISDAVDVRNLPTVS